MSDKTREEFEVMRRNFESKFPLPDGVMWRRECGYTSHSPTWGTTLATEYMGKLKSWQAATELERRNEKAVEFARHMFTEVWPEGGIDGGELQELGERFGFLEPVEVDRACGEGCVCDLYDSFPMTCYKPTFSTLTTKEQR